MLWLIHLAGYLGLETSKELSDVSQVKETETIVSNYGQARINGLLGSKERELWLAPQRYAYFHYFKIAMILLSEC